MRHPAVAVLGQQGAGGGGSFPSDGLATFLASYSCHAGYKFESSESGGTATDYGTEGADLSVGTISTTAGWAGLAVKVAGPTNYTWDNQPVSDMAAIVYLPASGPTTNTYGILSDGGATNGQFLAVRWASPVWQVAAYHRGGGTSYEAIATSVSSGWHMLGGQTNNGSSGCSVWVDGTKIDTAGTAATNNGAVNPEIGGVDQVPDTWSAAADIDSSGILISHVVVSDQVHGDSFYTDYWSDHGGA